MTAGPCEPADTLAIERVVLAPAKHRVVRATVARRGPHAARFSARIGPNATSEAELFRSPCQRISLLVHERFRPVHGSRRRSGGRGDATPQLPARQSGRCSRAAWLDLVDFLRGGSCRDYTWPCVHISSPARGHLVALRVSRGGDNWPCKCLELNVTNCPEKPFEGFSA